MLLGIVSDTHDDQDRVQAAVERFREAGADAVVHCGDVVAPFSATSFDGPWDFHAVRGNNDGEWALAGAVDAFGTYHGEFGELSLDGHRIAVYHGTSGAIVDALVASGTYDYVLCGHTHERAHEERDGTIRINPGGLPFSDAPGEPAAVLLDTASGAVTFEDLTPGA
jgi:putative phosphoesterase